MNELIFKAILSITSLSLTLLAFTLMLQFRKSRQVIPWALIFVSFLLHFTSNIMLIQDLISGQTINFPSYRDYLWITSYVLFALGIICYWLMINKSIMKSPIDDLIVITTMTIIILIINVYLANNDLLRDPIDILYSTTAALTGFACIPLIRLFNKGTMSKQWVYIGLRGLFILIGQIIFSIELSLNGVHNLSNITWLIGDVLAINGFIKLLNNTS